MQIKFEFECWFHFAKVVVYSDMHTFSSNVWKKGAWFLFFKVSLSIAWTSPELKQRHCPLKRWMSFPWTSAPWVNWKVQDEVNWVWSSNFVQCFDTIQWVISWQSSSPSLTIFDLSGTILSSGNWWGGALQKCRVNSAVSGCLGGVESRTERKI